MIFDEVETIINEVNCGEEGLSDLIRSVHGQTAHALQIDYMKGQSIMKHASSLARVLRAALPTILIILVAINPVAIATSEDERMTIVDGVVTGYWATFSHTTPVIPDGVTEIADQAFMSSNIKGITIPDTVTKIGDYAFSGCRYLEAVHLPDSVTDLGVGVFSNTKVLTEVRLPGGMTRISDSLFYNAASLATIEIPEGVTYIGEKAFASTLLSQIEFPAGLRAIGD